MASETAVSIPFSVMSEAVLSCQAWELLGGLAERFSKTALGKLVMEAASTVVH